MKNVKNKLLLKLGNRSRNPNGFTTTRFRFFGHLQPELIHFFSLYCTAEKGVGGYFDLIINYLKIKSILTILIFISLKNKHCFLLFFTVNVIFLLILYKTTSSPGRYIDNKVIYNE
ncbi:hypothetical protein [Rouxiella sp. Mn2063]|uniref:hypothetical protein n=1 Tax=Rouxiella sp. Mn2063 TaxID=3395262 RepID=UPI003BC471AB